MPVSLMAVEQSARLTLALFHSKEHNTDFVVGQVRSEIFNFAKKVLIVPDTPMEMNHSNFLGSYFSSTKAESLKQPTIAIANHLSGDDVEEKDAAILIGNVEIWADGLYQPSKKLLLLSIENRSHFALDY